MLALLLGAFGLASSSAAASVEPPPSDFDKVTAPMPVHGRRGAPPPPRLPDRLQPPGPVDLTAHDLGLVRQEDGSYLYLDPGRRFTARIGTDGRIHFADRWRRPDASRPERGSCCARPPEGVARAANPFWGAAVQGPLEWLVRSRGRDPTASAKAALLEQTRDFRTRLAVAWAIEHIAARLAALESELEAIWNADEIDDEQKRRLIFARWDECAERFETPTQGLPEDAIERIDEARIEAATEARAEIEAFVRRHAPAGSSAAYAKSELQRLNAQRISARPFAPYANKETP